MPRKYAIVLCARTALYHSYGYSIKGNTIVLFQTVSQVDESRMVFESVPSIDNEMILAIRVVREHTETGLLDQYFSLLSTLPRDARYGTLPFPHCTGLSKICRMSA